MHELSIAQSLIDTISLWHDANGGGRVMRAKIRVGRLSGVDPEALAYAWKTACEYDVTPEFLRGCALETDLLPLRFRCAGCGKTFENEKLLQTCPACGKDSLLHEGGRELTLKEIEVE